jgi:RND family efflux transporter MFP subunit
MNGTSDGGPVYGAARGMLCVFGLSAALASAGCARHLENEAHAGVADSRPQVTVARVTQSSVTEFSEHTGHTEAPNTVEIRARATGFLNHVGFHEGALVKKGDPLFEIDPRPYQAALRRTKAELESALVDDELARRNAARGERLFKDNAISTQESETLSATFRQLTARAEVASAAVASAQLDLEYASVRSPIDGRIGRILVTPGNLVGPELPTPLATVVSVNPLYVYIDVEETRALRLSRTAGAVARVGFAGEDGHPHEARIDFLDNRVDPQTGMLKVRAVLQNPDGRWVHGLFARVELPENDAHEAVMIADVAVATDQDRRFVWVVGSDGKVEHRQVKLGPLNGGLREVKEGLTGADRVIVRGLQRVGPGAMVAAEEISMSDAAHIDKVAGGAK